MRPTRRLALLLPAILFASGCASFGQAPGEAPPAARFATVLEASDPTVDAGVRMMDSFERRATREERAVAFALGRGGAAVVDPTFPGAGAAEAAGQVIAPAFTALGDYAHVLGQAAGGVRLEARPSPGPEVLVQAVDQALPAVKSPVPPPVRQAGLAGIGALARMAQQMDGQRAPSAQAMAAEAQPHLAATTALLRTVIGARTGEATRGAIRARRTAMEQAHARLLEAARSDRGLTTVGRYTLFHQVAALRDSDPLPGTLSAIVALLDAMEAAHAAIAAGDTAGTEEKLSAFEATLARMQTITGQDEQPAE